MTCRAVALMTIAGSLVAAPMMTGCQNLPGTPRSQLAVAGGVVGGIVGGAAAGTWWAGALIGAGIGLAAGYVIGLAAEEWFGWQGVDAPSAALDMPPPLIPATPEQALSAATADINLDGLVTLDELLAMHKAGLSDEEIMARLEATGLIFETSEVQQEFLLRHGVSLRLIESLPAVNAHERERVLALIAAEN